MTEIPYVPLYISSSLCPDNMQERDSGDGFYLYITKVTPLVWVSGVAYLK